MVVISCLWLSLIWLLVALDSVCLMWRTQDTRNGFLKRFLRDQLTTMSLFSNKWVTAVSLMVKDIAKALPTHGATQVVRGNGYQISGASYSHTVQEDNYGSISRDRQYFP